MANQDQDQIDGQAGLTVHLWRQSESEFWTVPITADIPARLTTYPVALVRQLLRTVGVYHRVPIGYRQRQPNQWPYLCSPTRVRALQILAKCKLHFEKPGCAFRPQAPACDHHNHKEPAPPRTSQT